MIDKSSEIKVDPGIFNINLDRYTMSAFLLEHAFHGDSVLIDKFDGKEKILIFYKNIEVSRRT